MLRRRSSPSLKTVYGLAHKEAFVTHLRQMMLDELQRRNYAQNTVRAYIHAVENFAKYFRRSPNRLGPDCAVSLARSEAAPHAPIHSCCRRRFARRTRKRITIPVTPAPSSKYSVVGP